MSKNDGRPAFRQAAITKLIDQIVLPRIAKNDSDRWVRAVAAEQLRVLRRK